MNRTLRLISLLALFFCIGAASTAYALDPPHNTADPLQKVNCSNCHFTNTTLADDLCLSCHNPVNMTGKYGVVQTHQGTGFTITCRTCHNPHYQRQASVFSAEGHIVTGTTTSIGTNTLYDSTAPFGAADSLKDYTLIPNLSYPSIMYRISGNTSDTLTVEGTIRGLPYAGAGKIYSVKYGKMVKDVITTPNSGNKQVKFFTSAENVLNNLADGLPKDPVTGYDTNVNGVCQVCHTKTTYFTNTGKVDENGAHPAVAGTNCATCHTHQDNFKPTCNSCHGNPPVDSTTLVFSPAPTGSTTAGVHAKHVSTLLYACATCHVNSTGFGTTHNNPADANRTVTLGFSLYSGVRLGGQYNGQTTTHYDSSEPNTIVSNTGSPGDGSLTCSNLYCHSIVQTNGGGALTKDTSDYKTPSWDNTAPNTVICGKCHGDNRETPSSNHTGIIIASGSHTKHVSESTGYGMACGNCHSTGGSGTAQHANNAINVVFATSYGGSYNGSNTSPGNHTAGQGYGTCSTSYCHSSGQSADGSSATPDYASPIWGNAASGACGTCHGTTSGTTKGQIGTGSHTPHLAISATCETCHTGAGNGTSYTDPAHVDTTIDVSVDVTYSAGGTPGNSYGTCSTTACHGPGSPTWGNNTTSDQCTKCHGTPTASPAPDTKKAPPTDLAGDSANTDAQVGAHQAHLGATHNYSSTIACSECHVIPAAFNSNGHIYDGVNDTTQGVAEVPIPGPLARTGGLTPQYNVPSAGRCSTTWCHGAGLSGGDKVPKWNTPILTGVASNDCAQCHGYPPSTSMHSGKVPTDCVSCHTHVNTAGTGFSDRTLHVNGVKEGGDNCSDCHSSAGGATSGTTADTYHGKHGSISFVGKLSLNDYGNTAKGWYSYSNTGGVPSMGCGYCHPKSSATHMDGSLNLNFDPAEHVDMAGTLKAKNAATPSFTQNPRVSVVCASVYCHSNGYYNGTAYGYVSTPNWYGGSFSVEKCSACHGNQPGTNAHGAHVVAIHYTDIYSGGTGKIAASGAVDSGAAHGDPNTSTTINCNMCHYDTVTSSANDKNTTCVTCHTGANLKGNAAIAAASTKHLDGSPTVAFNAVSVKSKAQIRDNITTVKELNDSWTRTNNYKSATNSHDAAKNALNTGTMWTSGTKTCSNVSCHNSNSVTWTSTTTSCSTCHTTLP
jgi:predicted CxxxxCH...CXXCH cytochrome family protein